MAPAPLRHCLLKAPRAIRHDRASPEKPTGSCYCCSASQQVALAVANVQGFTPHLKKNIRHIVRSIISSSAVPLWKMGPQLFWPENSVALLILSFYRLGGCSQ